MGSHTLFIGHSIITLDRVDSTNNYLHGLLSKNPPAEGFIVRAVEQYAGKGQRGNSWLSQPGVNLTFSLLLSPGFLPLSEQFWLTKALALGVAEFVRGMAPNASVAIKWPNDVYVNERKIAGILVENILEKSVIKYSIAGIGLNVNQDSFDPSLPNATSLKILSGKNCDLLICLENLCISIEKFYLELRGAEYKRIDALYHKLLYKKDILSKFMLDGKPCEGTIKGVSAQGHLLINAKNGSELIVNDTIEVKDVKHLVFL
jgi:BirA family transcriptional regulator, biotin operon repressor / biotin---[acetyl-CoA-carboxylase] ligase